MAWTPQNEQLAQLAQCLRDSLSGHDRQAQKSAEQMLEQAKASPDFVNYLTYLCVTPDNHFGLNNETWSTARTVAAITLKNHIRSHYKSIPEQQKAYIKSTVLNGLSDPLPQIRSYVGNVVTEILSKGGVRGWPDLILQLTALVEKEGGAIYSDLRDSAMSALVKVCEDNKEALDEEVDSQQRPLDFLLPKLLNFMTNRDPKTRQRALSAINVFLTEPVALSALQHINEILPRIVQLCTDKDGNVRRFVCRAFAVLADSMPTVLRPHVEGIVEYTLSQQRDLNNPDLALDAAEFFFEASSDTSLLQSLGPYVDRIVPVLLDSMVYDEDDQMRLEDDEEGDADVEDEEKDIKPQFATAKQGRSDATASQSNGQEKPSINGYAFADDDDLSDGEIAEDDDLDIDPEDEWNLRKCSAASLDSLATKFGEPVFKSALPWLQTNLASEDWPNREAAVLALGAIGPGCIQHIKPNLPELVPYLIRLLTDKQAVVRQISCWALCRFAGWASQLDEAGKQQFFEPMMDGVLQRMLDSHKKVQESAASAFATLEEAANVQLTPYCGVIIQQFNKCFERYKDKNIYILYDCVQTLAEHAGPTLAQPELVDILMPALIARWQKVGDQSREMFPLLECLAFVATALGTAFAPYAQPLWKRCINIIAQNLEESSNANGDSWMEPDKDFLVTSLDLLSSIIQSLEQAQSTELASTADPNMFLLLAHCLKHSDNDVKQSAYALLGDCAIYIFPLLRQYLDDLMQLLIVQLDLSQVGRDPVRHDPETTFRVINNACWSCGEISMRHGAGMDKYISSLMPKLAVIMFSDQVPGSLNENAAIAVGRLGIGCHQQLAPHLKEFAQPFLKAMMKIGWTDEKGHAYKGFSRVVLDNPQALEHVLLDFMMEMANAPGVFLTGMQDDGPQSGFERVLQQYKQLIGDNWDQFLHHLPPPQEQALRQLYVF